MYDDLILRLRDAAKMSDALAVLLPHSEGNATAKLYNEAADAIEELRKLADAIPHVCECCVGCELEKKNGGCDNAFILSPKRAMQYLIKPRWIPVTERLPSAEKEVYVTDGEYIARAVLYDEVFPGDKPCWSYSGLGEITHWCEQIPLPQSPKEET